MLQYSPKKYIYLDLIIIMGENLVLDNRLIELFLEGIDNIIDLDHDIFPENLI